MVRSKLEAILSERFVEILAVLREASIEDEGEVAGRLLGTEVANVVGRLERLERRRQSEAMGE